MVSKLSNVFRSLVGSDGSTSRSRPRKRALESENDDIENDVEDDVLESPQVKRVKSRHTDSSALSPVSSPSVALGKFASWIKVKGSSFVDLYFSRHPDNLHSNNDRYPTGDQQQSSHALRRRPLHGTDSKKTTVRDMPSKGNIVNQAGQGRNPSQHSNTSNSEGDKGSHVRGNHQRPHQQSGNYNGGLPPGARHKTVTGSNAIMVNGNGHGEDEADVEEVLLDRQHHFRTPLEVDRNKILQRQHKSTSQAAHRSHIPRGTQTTAVTSMRVKQPTEHHPSRNYQPVANKLFPQQRLPSVRGHRSSSRNSTTADECVRLKEKKCYQDLLQQLSCSSKSKFSASSSASVLSSKSQVRSVVEPPRIQRQNPPHQHLITTDIGSLVRKPIVHTQPAVPGSRVLPHQYNSKKEVRDAVRLRCHVPVSELSPKLTPPHAMLTAATPAQPDFSYDSTSRPESPVITSVISASTCESRGVSPMTVFERSFRNSPYTLEDWVKNMKDKYEYSMRLKNRQVEEQEAIVKLHEERRLKEQTKLIDRIREQMTITEKLEAVVEDVFLEDEEDEDEIEELEEEEELAELTPEMEDEIDDALVPHPPNETLLEGFKLLITRHDIQTLNGLNWLNDEVINFYMQLIMARSNQDNYPNVHCFNTFFYPKLLKGGQASLRRWTKRVDIFAKDLIVVPVHLGMHWCMAIIDLRKSTITYYDSMGSHNRKCLESLREYLRAEHQDKKGSAYDLSGWSCTTAKDIPQQLNGSDCGMFACKFAEYITRDAEITFTQHDMPYFRRRMIWEILHMELL